MHRVAQHATDLRSQSRLQKIYRLLYVASIVSRERAELDILFRAPAQFGDVGEEGLAGRGLTSSLQVIDVKATRGQAYFKKVRYATMHR